MMRGEAGIAFLRLPAPHVCVRERRPALRLFLLYSWHTSEMLNAKSGVALSFFLFKPVHKNRYGIHNHIGNAKSEWKGTRTAQAHHVIGRSGSGRPTRTAQAPRPFFHPSPVPTSVYFHTQYLVEPRAIKSLT